MRNEATLSVYLDEINKQAEHYIQELDELAQLSELKNRDYYAVERLLQVLIEACIGISKHWLKSLGKSAPNDAYKSFELLIGYNLLPATELATWRKIIGLRNALVHNYLNLEKEIILSVLHRHYYRHLEKFIQTATQNIIQNSNKNSSM